MKCVIISHANFQRYVMTHDTIFKLWLDIHDAWDNGIKEEELRGDISWSRKLNSRSFYSIDIYPSQPR